MKQMSSLLKDYSARVLRLVLGMFLYAVGIALMLNANIGYAPWDVFHAGLSNMLGISYGTASIAVGLIIVVFVALCGEKLGLGTILNMLLIGLFADIILVSDILPVSTNFAYGLLMLLTGMFIISVGTYFYINSALGAGPRDSMMVVLTRKTKLPVGVCRSIIELIAAVSGWFLGGMVGVGTIVSIIGIGFFIQSTFRLFKFNPTDVKHETLDYTVKVFMSHLKQ